VTDREYQDIKRNFSDRAWRLNNLYYVQDEQGHRVKFRMNAVQRLFFENLWFLNIVLKSRQHGITTFICILFLDICLFNDNVSAGVIADNLNDAKKFFDQKIYYAYRNLPEQLRNEIRLITDTSMELVFSNDSRISTGVSLRSGTCQYLHISEFGKVCARYPEKAREIVTGALNTVHVGQYVFIESTAEGRSGYFYDFCQDALKRQQEGRAATKLEYRLHFFGWHQDAKNRLPVDDSTPRLSTEMAEYFAGLEAKHGIVLSDEQKAWYAAKKKTQGEDMLREHPSTPEEAFQASIQGAYYQKQMLFLRSQRPCRITPIPYEPSIPVNTSWDLGMDDCTCIVFHQRVGMENRIIDYLEGSGEGLPFYVMELQRRGYVYGKHHLPHDVSVRSLNDGVSRQEKLQQLGLRNLVTVSRTANIEDGIEEVRKFLTTCWIDEVKCQRLIAALDEYRKQWDEKLGVFRSYPLHNWASNPADAIRTLACGYVYRSQGQSRDNDDYLPAAENYDDWKTA
jgi:hypothetical protein